MATRMQQRRGTAQQWIDAAPVVLAPGEIGFETDSNQFKMGDGTTEWQALSYFKNLESLGGSLDDYIPLTQKGIAGGVPTLDVNGVIPIAQLPGAAALDAEVTSAVSAATSALETSVQTLDEKVDTNHTTAMSNTASSIATAISTEITRANNAYDAYGSAANAQTAGEAAAEVAGNAAKAYADTEISDAITAEQTARNLAIDAAVDAEVVLRDAAIEAAVDAEVVLRDAAIASQSTSDRGYTDTAISTLNTSVSGALDTHATDSTNVHGIADTAALATMAYADQAETDAITAAGTAADTKISTAVAALTKSSVGLGNVDNTSDANKPVSTATQTALDAKASLAGATFTGNVEVDGNIVVDGDLTVNGTNFSASATSITIEDNMVQLAHQNAANTVDLGIVVGYNDGSAKHAGLVRDVSDAKWKLFKGVTTEPSTTVDFTQGSLDDLKVAAFEATTVTPSAGIVFSDGTQTKVGVPSITTFATAISSSATLAAGEADKFVPLTGAVTITLPATGYSTGQSIDFYQASGTGAQFASTNSVVGTPGLKFRTTNSVVTAMKTSSGWLVFGDLSA
jgi:hypothetical protein